PLLELALGGPRPRPDRRRRLGLGVRLLAALAARAPEQEEDPADQPERLLVLDRVDRLPLELADVGADRRAEAALVVRLDHLARCGLDVLAERSDLPRRQRMLDPPLVDRPDALGRDVDRLAERG